jgi:hypothetical protein
MKALGLHSHSGGEHDHEHEHEHSEAVDHKLVIWRMCLIVGSN